MPIQFTKAGAKAYFDELCGTLPLLPGTKRPVPEALGWPEMSQAQRDKMFRRYPDANVGIAIGKTKGGKYLVCIDFEKIEDAKKFFEKWNRLLYETLVVKTVHGGIHVWFLVDGQLPHSQKVFGDEHPVDMISKANGAGCPGNEIDHALCDSDSKACPKKGITGYEIISEVYAPLHIEGDFLKTLADRAAKLGWKFTVERAPRLDVEEMLKNGIPVGKRNDQLHRLFCSYLRVYDPDIAYAAASWVNARCKPPLGERELKTMFASAASWYRRTGQEGEQKVSSLIRTMEARRNA